jgi:hypothetical protein
VFLATGGGDGVETAAKLARPRSSASRRRSSSSAARIATALERLEEEL